MKWVFRVILGLVAVVAIGVVTLLFLPAEKIAQIAEQRFQAATGRALTVTGDVRPTIWPTLGVTTGAVSVANAPWSKEGPMLKAEALSVQVDLAALIRGNVRIKGFSATAPDILLEIGPDGRGNWEFESAGAGGSGGSGDGGGLPPLSLDSATVKNGALRFIDHKGGSDLRLSALDGTLAIPSLEARSSFDFSALVNGQPSRLTGHIDGLGGFLSKGAVPLDAVASVGRSKLTFKGRGGLVPVAMAGRLDADASDMAALMGAAGQGAVTLPAGLGRDTLKVAGEMTYVDNALSLRGATLTLDKNTLTGDADVTLGGERPVVNAKLSAGALDLTALSAEDSGGSASPANAGWSKAPIDVSGLHALDAKLTLAASSIDIGSTKLGATALYTTLERGRAVTEIKQLNAYGGSIDGSIVVNARGGLSARAVLDGSALAISKLLGELIGFDRLLAAGDLSIDLLGVGNDMDTLMRSLKGQGRFATTSGELLGLDLVGMLRHLDPGYIGEGSKTLFDKIAASFTVTDGVLHNDDLALLAPLIAANGAGQLDLGAQTINYRLVPRLLGNDDVRVPVLITGPWAKPRFKLDLESLAKEKLDAEKDRLEARAKDKLREKLEAELGTQLDPDQSLEDTVKQKLEEEAKKGLLNLLSGD